MPLVLFLWLAGGCASNQEAYEASMQEGAERGTGLFRQEDLPPGHRPEAESAEAALWQIMESSEQTLRLSGQTLRDEEMLAYLKGIVCRLAPEHCAGIRIYITRRPAFNAFMAPNGMMEVWNGLFLRVRNEAQLAAILGHELGHYLRRHALQRYETARAKRKAMALLSVATGLAGIPLATDVADLFTSGGVVAYERDQEREADGLGLKLMVQAGYDPGEAAKLWGLVTELSALKKGQEESEATLFSSHPVSAERSAELGQLARKILAERPPGPRQPLELGVERWREKLLPRRTPLLQDEVLQPHPAASVRLLERLVEDGAQKGELLFFLGESYRRRGEEGDGDRTLATLALALKEGYSGGAVLRAASAICLRPERPQEACAELGRAASAAIQERPSVFHGRRYHPKPAEDEEP